MGKLKNLEKKATKAIEFDQKTPESRVKSINNEKPVKKPKIQKKSDGTANPKKETDTAGEKKKKKAKIITQIKQEVAANAKKIETEGIKEDADKLVAREVVKKALIALKDGVKKEAEGNTSKNLFDDEMRFGLQVVAVKVPNCPTHVRKM
jgi:hypothetical protein